MAGSDPAELIRQQELLNRELDSENLFSYADGLLESDGVSTPQPALSSPARKNKMSLKVQQAARASQERKRSAVTPPSSSSIAEAFPIGGNSRDGQPLPNPPSPARVGQNLSTSPRSSDISSLPRSAPRGVAPSPSTTSTDGGDMGEEASVRFLKAKLSVLQQQVNHHSGVSSDLKQQLSESEAMRKEMADEMKRVRRNESSMSDKLQKETRAKESAEAEAERLRQEVSKLRQEAESAKRGARSAESETKTRDVRLQRALDDAKKCKDNLAQERSRHSEELGGLRKEISKLENRAIKLEKQKAEVLSGFKKQLKLIDVLKRQKVHIEAARAIAFSEEEFMKTLDWGVN